MELTPSQPINPHFLYTKQQVADILNVDARWVKNNMLNVPRDRMCRHKKQGNVTLILGKWIIEWAQDEHDHNGDCEE